MVHESDVTEDVLEGVGTELQTPHKLDEVYMCQLESLQCHILSYGAVLPASTCSRLRLCGHPSLDRRSGANG